ncbi:MAG: hypothetical protein JSR46_07265 [Verrucomicrobia bacterium]|nr:hypothetical protein [Verrucomicrobiota bacterium]
MIPYDGTLNSWQMTTEEFIDGFFENIIPQVVGDYSTYIAGKIFYPLVGKTTIILWDGEQKRVVPVEEIAQWVDSSEITKIPVFDTSDFRNLDARYRQHAREKARETVVLFHANAMTCDNMKEWGDFYFDQGYDVLMPTIGGYPGSDPVEVCEASTYQDVEGILLFLQNHGVTRAGYHGLSIGACLALQAAVGPTATTKVATTFVVADQPFNTGVEVASNFICNRGHSFASSLAKGTARAALPCDQIISLGDKIKIVTDGLDNIKKVKLLKELGIPFLIIESSHDMIMGLEGNEEGGFLSNLAEELLLTRYDAIEDADQNRIVLSGEHCSFFGDNEQARALVMKFAASFMPIKIDPATVKEDLAIRLSAHLGIESKGKTIL